MKLTIDIGNTCIKLVAFDGDTPIESCHAEHDEPYKIVEFCSRHDFTKGIWSTVYRFHLSHRKPAFPYHAIGIGQDSGTSEHWL